MAIILKNTMDYLIEISDIPLTLLPNESMSITDEKVDSFKLASSNELVKRISSGHIIVNDGFNDLDEIQGVKYVSKDRTLGRMDHLGKMFVHESPRPFGTVTYFYGSGDDTTNVSDVGNGQRLEIDHKVGDPLIQNIYVDFNILTRRLWIQEGLFFWNNCQLDTISVYVVPRVTSWIVGENTNYNFVNGLIVPAAGNGTCSITSDISTSTGGLVYIPTKEDGTRPLPCYWNATWNSTTQRYENISPVIDGSGSYALFGVEVPMVKFVNNLILLGSGAHTLHTADIAEFGNGMRFKLTATTNTSNGREDHDWQMSGIFTCFAS